MNFKHYLKIILKKFRSSKKVCSNCEYWKGYKECDRKYPNLIVGECTEIKRLLYVEIEGWSKVESVDTLKNFGCKLFIKAVKI